VTYDKSSSTDNQGPRSGTYNLSYKFICQLISKLIKITNDFNNSYQVDS
jgi:hypothetical protein